MMIKYNLSELSKLTDKELKKVFTKKTNPTLEMVQIKLGKLKK